MVASKPPHKMVQYGSGTTAEHIGFRNCSPKVHTDPNKSVILVMHSAPAEYLVLRSLDVSFFSKPIIKFCLDTQRILHSAPTEYQVLRYLDASFFHNRSSRAYPRYLGEMLGMFPPYPARSNRA